MKLRMGKHELEYGSPYLGEMRDANSALHDPDALRRQLAEDGYLLLRGLLPADGVLDARRAVLERLAAQDCLAPDTGMMEGRFRPGARGVFFGGKKEVTHDARMLQVLEGERIMSFFAHLLGGGVLTYDYKWLRCVGPGEHTGAHYDIVYMGRGTQNVYTCWIPYTEVGLDSAPLAVCAGSHRFEKIKQTYGRMDVDRDLVSGWFSDNPREIVETYGGRWLTATFSPGDALVMSMFTMHGSFNNESGRYRISSDTRYQLACEPVDERWVGDEPLAHYAWGKDPSRMVTMEEARAKWGV